MSANFNSIFKDVTKLLNEKLPVYLTYHNTAHTLYVLKKAIHIAEKEKVSQADLKLIKIAALYHDIGFTVTPKEHEKESCKIAKKQLKKYQYSDNDIDIICGMIMATKIPQNPQNLLEQVLADADLEYLATSQFSLKANNLYKELRYFNPKLSINEWNSIQLKFINNHQYHTKYSKHYKTFRKLNNVVQLKKIV